MNPQSTTHTFTTPTCTLNVNTKAQQLSAKAVRQPARRGGTFSLQIDHPDRGEPAPAILTGDTQTLDELQQLVSKYIADLIAKFPAQSSKVPTPPQPQPSESAQPPIAPPEPPRSEPEKPSGLFKNLPGLRKVAPPAAPLDATPDRTQSTVSGLRQHDARQHSRSANQPHPAVPAKRVPQQPYLTGGERSLDHQFHLGDLATAESGAVISLSALQLFDLATVLDEYAAVKATATPRTGGTKVHAVATGTNSRLDPTATVPPSRLPNLPQPTTVLQNPVYSRRRRGAMSAALPWVAAAAALVGVPLLLLSLDHKAANNLNSQSAPDRTTTKTTVTTTTVPPIARPSAAPETLPKPWQPQSVQPPATPKVSVPSPTNPAPTASAGTVATLPSTNPLASGIAPVPTTGSTTTTPPQVAVKPTKPIVTSKPTPKPATRPSQPKAKPANTGISVSTQPISILQESSPPVPKTSAPKQLPIPPQISAPVQRVKGDGIDPPAVATTQQPPLQVDPAPRTSTPATVPLLTPSPTIEPKPYQPNPNLIVPQSAASPNPTASNTPATPEASSVQASNPRPSNQGENAVLQAAKQYFQGKWKANAAEANSLQYVLDVNGKNGVVRSINPQGEAANDYLKQSKFIKPGQKIAPSVAGSGDRKIRVLLQADGNVETFIEP